MPQAEPDTDVLIIGAGVSGIGMAAHLARDCPQLTYTVLERRARVGGTWDLFRYPGIRSDSDMYTFGYAFRPWTDTRVLADGASIRQYVADTAAEYGVDGRITFGRKVITACWSTDEKRWTVDSVDEASGTTHRTTARFLVSATGYYDYDQGFRGGGFRPDFPGEERFAGQLIHPQHWPEDLDWAGKRVVIIGSGATAITLVPALAETAAHVTMVQRSPSYILSLPGVDRVSAGLGRLLPQGVVYKLARARNIALQRGLYVAARTRPAAVRALVRRSAARLLRGSSDLANFSPTYQPWDQRMCFVPDGDLFAAIRSGKAEVVTGRIATFTETGIDLEDGGHLDADIVITATGLAVQMLGGTSLDVDGDAIDLHDKVTYKGVLVEDLPNMAMIFGYINASWTLKADVAATYLTRLLNHMSAHGYTEVVERANAADRTSDSVMSSLSSGYVLRGDPVLPRQGSRGPWKVSNDFLRDAPMLRLRPVDDGTLIFDDTPPRPATARRTDPRGAAV